LERFIEERSSQKGFGELHELRMFVVEEVVPFLSRRYLT